MQVVIIINIVIIVAVVTLNIELCPVTSLQILRIEWRTYWIGIPCFKCCCVQSQLISVCMCVSGYVRLLQCKSQSKREKQLTHIHTRIHRRKYDRFHGWSSAIITTCNSCKLHYQTMMNINHISILICSYDLYQLCMPISCIEVHDGR